ncbi:uncharacterized protein LOC116616225 [Nematostella vectensis]|uniref:uncharacterized protein LOC116616225 n=1 Tax=Nematostella vectensis TaxID=45351 RepID=UPI0020775D2E|nr:uncharacterized protein LOC116616225 [Nematostella vectensis]
MLSSAAMNMDLVQSDSSSSPNEKGFYVALVLVLGVCLFLTWVFKHLVLDKGKRLLRRKELSKSEKQREKRKLKKMRKHAKKQEEGIPGSHEQDPSRELKRPIGFKKLYRRGHNL